MSEGMVDLSPNRENKPNNTAQPQPATQPIPYEFQKKEGSRWPTLLIYGLSALVVAAVIVLSSRWIYQKTKDNETNKKPTTAQSSNNANNDHTKQAPASKESDNKSGSSPQNPSGQGSTPPPASTPTPTTVPVTGDSTDDENTATQLPVTGG